MTLRTPWLRVAIDQGKIDRIDSGLEATFALQLKVGQFPRWERNFLFHPEHKLELDFAWPGVRFGVEIQGGVHRISRQANRDSRKAALALLQGWIILPITPPFVKDGQGATWTRKLLERLLTQAAIPASSQPSVGAVERYQTIPILASESAVGRAGRP